MATTPKRIWSDCTNGCVLGIRVEMKISRRGSLTGEIQACTECTQGDEPDDVANPKAASFVVAALTALRDVAEYVWSPDYDAGGPDDDLSSEMVRQIAARLRFLKPESGS